MSDKATLVAAAQASIHEHGRTHPTDATGKLSAREGADMTEEEFLAAYEVRDYPRPSVTADLVIFTIIDGVLCTLLIKRGGHPFRDCWAFPGGFVNVKTPVEERGPDYDEKKDQGESVDDAAGRELEEETGLPKGSCYLEQLYTFGAPYRDPRTRTITVAYFALVRSSLAAAAVAGDDARDVRWAPTQDLLDGKVPDGTRLAFDHDVILAKAVERIRGRIDYSPIAFDLVPETFTATELRVVYEAVKGRAYDAKNFYRRFRRMQADGIIELAPGKRATGSKHAQVYRFKR
jgi:8-oxo-dGTP diphosphatase